MQVLAIRCKLTLLKLRAVAVAVAEMRLVALEVPAVVVLVG